MKEIIFFTRVFTQWVNKWKGNDFAQGTRVSLLIQHIFWCRCSQPTSQFLITSRGCLLGWSKSRSASAACLHPAIPSTAGPTPPPCDPPCLSHWLLSLRLPPQSCVHSADLNESSSLVLHDFSWVCTTCGNAPHVHRRPAAPPGTASVLPRPVARKAAMQVMARSQPRSGGGRSISLCSFCPCRPWPPRALSLCICFDFLYLEAEEVRGRLNGESGSRPEGLVLGDKYAGVLSRGSLGAPVSRAGLGALLGT